MQCWIYHGTNCSGEHSEPFDHSMVKRLIKWTKHLVFLRNVLASGSADDTVILWDLSQGKPATTLQRHADKVLKGSDYNPFIVHNRYNILRICRLQLRENIWYFTGSDVIVPPVWGTDADIRIIWQVSVIESENILLSTYGANSFSVFRTAVLYDCRSPDNSYRTWRFSGQVERLAWDHFSPCNFLVAAQIQFIKQII